MNRDATVLRRQRGVSLVELLVSVTILAVATTIALVLYDGARRSFKVGENVSEQQQAVRIAFDLVSSDLRLAGYNINPDGNKTRPDEPLEGAFERAVVVRADFDAKDVVEREDPEETLGGAGSAFLTVTTGNDEIRAYVLAKPDGSSGGTLAFQADVGETVRNGSVESVLIPNVALTHTDPPYTLYRITLDDDANPQRTVLIENVRSMRFSYYDRAETLLVAPGGLDDETGVNARGRIHRVGVEIEALTRDPDLNWFDRDDPDPDTRSFRKFRLEGDITPRNQGLIGIKDFQADTTAPSRPSAPQLWPGHCGGLYVTWPPNPAEDETHHYRLLFGTNPANLAAQRAVDGTAYYVSGLADDTQYWVAVQAVDGSGNKSDIGPMSGILTVNTNVPLSPPGLTASDSVDGRIETAWSLVDANTADTSGDPQSPLLREMAGYRVYRDESAGVASDPAKRVADETDIAGVPDPAFVDERIVNCREYHYAVAAVDQCGMESDLSGEASGRSTSNVDPVAPQNVGAYSAGAGKWRVEWDEVHEDVDGNPIYIDEYEVWRTGSMAAGVPPSVPGDFGHHVATVSDGGQEYTDTFDPGVGQAVWYAVKAKDDCPNFSDFSDPVEPLCYFSGIAEIVTPHWDDRMWGPSEIHVTVLDGLGFYSEMRFTITNKSTGEETFYTFDSTTGPPWLLNWDAGSAEFPIARYRLHADVDQVVMATVCTDGSSTEVEVAP